MGFTVYIDSYYLTCTLLVFTGYIHSALLLKNELKCTTDLRMFQMQEQKGSERGGPLSGSPLIQLTSTV